MRVERKDKEEKKKEKLRVSLVETAASELAGMSNELEVSERARQDLRGLATRPFFVAPSAATLWDSASDELRGYFGKSVPEQNLGKKVQVILSVHEGFGSADESEEVGKE